MKHLSKEKWMEDTLESLKGSQRAQAPNDLFERAMNRAVNNRAIKVRMPAAQVWSAAACALVLVVANLFMCLDFSHSGPKRVDAKAMFVQEYFGATDAPQF
jgi:hypothetical protein